MLEGIEVTVYGKDAAEADRLITIGGSVIVAAAAETLLTAASANQFGYLVYMRADCTVASTTGGNWSLRLGAAGPVILILQQPVVAAPVGSSYCWPFPVPWKTTAKGGQFTVQPSVATMGTWQFYVNGFHSSL
jgi:hypothetical protein